MDFSKLNSKALVVRETIEQFEVKNYGKSWNINDLMIGLQGDVGDLAKLIQASQGVRNIDDWKSKLEHELSDCLWSIMILANKLNVDLESSFVKNMDELNMIMKKKIEEERNS